jgi:hypothetical protein
VDSIYVVVIGIFAIALISLASGGNVTDQKGPDDFSHLALIIDPFGENTSMAK